ncbi:glycosyltransferase family 2 protein [Treponema sp.]|uniref:glycosyltransferase family 2 protein n=1 Tax=Treponema sp. TaxID=166 RepID=UPI00298D99C2|nr:glycosyltransferase [Treponema sp.]MCQ2242343.1 glycosyltransferase [Treponema sp.]
MSDLVSIVVPVYNVELYLERCLNSIINQTYKNIEIICVDDGSTDNSGNICDIYKEKDSRIKVIHKENGGLSDARNTGLLNANGKWILYVDSDDYIELDSVEKLTGCVADEEDVDIVVGSGKRIENGKTMSSYNHTNLQNKKYKSRDYILKSIRNHEFFAPTWLNLYKKDYLLNSNLIFYKGLIYEDMELLPKLFSKASTVYFLDYQFYNYIVRPGSITTSSKIEDVQYSAKLIIRSWYTTISQIEDLKLQKAMFSHFVRISLGFVGKFSIEDNIYPDGTGLLFFLKKAHEIKLIAACIIYGISRKLFIKIFQKLYL